MEQFSLEKYLENSSRKVVTRDGRSVRIICTDANEETPIAALVTVNDMGRDKLATALYTKDGRYGGGNSHYDLFFADEEERLSEFEKAMINIVFKYKYWSNSKDEVKQYIKKDSKPLLDLARKELLKDLPKWKKATENKDFDTHVLLFECENEVVLTEGIYKDEYYIELEDLKSLPKE